MRLARPTALAQLLRFCPGRGWSLSMRGLTGSRGVGPKGAGSDCAEPTAFFS